MKLKYLFPIIIAAIAILMGCSSDNDPIYLGNISVSTSYVSLDKDGGSTDVSLKAAADWSIDETTVPEWLSIAPMSGAAGTQTLKFSAEAGGSRSATVKLNCGGETQEINVLQYAEETDPVILTVAEAVAMIKAGTQPESAVYVKGIVCRVQEISVQYGNATYFLSDDGNYGDGNWLQVYRGYWINGEKFTSGDEFSVGDEMVIKAVLIDYNGTPETQQSTAEVISVKKSLIKIEEGADNAFTADGGDFLVRLTVSGNGPSIDVEESAKSWVGITSIEETDTTTNIMFHVAPNTSEAARSAVISFTTKSSSASSTVTATVSQMGLMGTKTNPFTIEQAIEYCQTLSGNSANDFYVKGIISRITSGGEFGSYGNATFYLSDDGEFLGEDDRNPDKAHDFEAYRVLYFDNEKWTEDNKGNISVGDEVVICGKLTLYNGISETAGNAAYICSINSVTTDANGLGSLDYPFNTAGAISFIDNGGQNDVFVKGIVSEIANNGQFGAQYGNGTFWMSDDGIRHNDAALDFEAYRVLWLGNRKWQEGDDLIAVGDEVIIRGQLTKYGTTYETSSGNAYVYSHNGATE